jgi:hypothetical protein
VDLGLRPYMLTVSTLISFSVGGGGGDQWLNGLARWFQQLKSECSLASFLVVTTEAAATAATGGPASPDAKCTGADQEKKGGGAKSQK